MNCSLREAAPGDIGFLREMLYEAAFWRPGPERAPMEEALARPELAKILRNWGRDGDTAVLAVVSGNVPVGAAWYRLWSEEDHSFGYVGPEVPELGIAVAATHRGRGVGAQLLAAILNLAAGQGIRRVSLSVERDNPAVLLYKRYGFTAVGALGNSWTMVAETAGKPRDRITG
jgi:ribosomal-protein-alanine N-acetyltransferase